MGFFKTSKVHDNEVAKADDFEFGFKSIIDNFSMGMSLILENSKNFIIGGNVTSSGDLTVKVAPIFSYCTSKVGELYQAVGSDETVENISVDAGDSASRIDILEVCGVVEEYDSQQRAVNSGESITYPNLNVKQRIKANFVVKKGVAGSETAPATDNGYVKIAEIKVPANAVSIQNSDIFNVTADNSDSENTEWTNEKTATINIGSISSVNNRFRKEHNFNGTHKNNVIHASNIDFGLSNTQVNAAKIPSGINKTVGTDSITSIDAVSNALIVMIDNIQALYNAYLMFDKYNFKGELHLSNVSNNETLLLPLIMGSDGEKAYCKLGTKNIFEITSAGKLRMADDYTAVAQNDIAVKKDIDTLQVQVDSNGRRIDALESGADNSAYINNVLGRFTVINGNNALGVKYATTENISLNGSTVIDGVTIPAGTIVLVKNQTDARQNGIYEASASSVWNRHNSYSTYESIKYKIFEVEYGNVNKGKLFYCPDFSLGIDVDKINFTEYKKLIGCQIEDQSISFKKLGNDIAETSAIQNSTKLITSGGVFSELNNLMNKNTSRPESIEADTPTFWKAKGNGFYYLDSDIVLSQPDTGFMLNMVSNDNVMQILFSDTKSVYIRNASDSAWSNSWHTIPVDLESSRAILNGSLYIG